MEPYEITEVKLPCYTVEVLGENGWRTLTVTPFETQEEAQEHIKEYLPHYPVLQGKIRVSKYTKEMWRADLIRAVMKDEDAMERALSILRNETLADLLKP